MPALTVDWIIWLEFAGLDSVPNNKNYHTNNMCDIQTKEFGAAIDHFKRHPGIHFCLIRRIEKVRQVSETIFQACGGSMIKYAAAGIDAELPGLKIGFMNLSGGQCHALQPKCFVTGS